VQDSRHFKAFQFLGGESPTSPTFENLAEVCFLGQRQGKLLAHFHGHFLLGIASDKHFVWKLPPDHYIERGRVKLAGLGSEADYIDTTGDMGACWCGNEISAFFLCYWHISFVLLVV